MATTWQLQEAKNRLSEVVDLAIEKGPQTVTRHGKEVVVIVSKADFDKKRVSSGPRGTALTFLRSLAFSRTRLSVERSRDLDRDIEL